jgi:hypothetical protein
LNFDIASGCSSRLHCVLLVARYCEDQKKSKALVIDCLDYQEYFGLIDHKIRSIKTYYKTYMPGYSYAPQQYYYTTPEVQHTNTLYVYDNYYTSTTNSNIDVARYNDSDSFSYVDYNFENYMQQPMLNNMHTLNFDATSNIQHTSFHKLAVQHVHMPMNNYQGQTNMMNSANLYETPCANNFSAIQQGVHMFIHRQQIHNI